jgi:signal transduction histidine kinase
MVSRLRSIGARRQGDYALAAAAVVLLAIELSVENIHGPWPVNWGFGLVMTGSLLWRRRWPVVVVAAQLAAGILQGIAGGDLVSEPFAPFFSVLLGFYSVGVHAPEVWALRALAFGIPGVVAVSVASDQTSVGDILFPVVLVACAPWIAGRAVRAWAIRARELAAANERLRAEQEQRALLAVADERGRIARELHDVVAHSISVMVVQSEGAKRMMDRDPQRAKQALEQIEMTGRSALVEMRRLLGVLRRGDEDAALAPQPGVEALDLLIDRAHEAGLDVDVAVEGERRTLPAGVDVSVYRIVQEALTNVLKHAGPAHADVVLTYGPNQVEVEVVDSGPVNGFVPPAYDPDNPSHGILGMRERVKVYGGEVTAGPVGDPVLGHRGYRVWARIPLGAA